MSPSGTNILKTGMFSKRSVLESHFGQFTEAFIDFVVGVDQFCTLQFYLLLIVFQEFEKVFLNGSIFYLHQVQEIVGPQQAIIIDVIYGEDQYEDVLIFHGQKLFDHVLKLIVAYEWWAVDMLYEFIYDPLREVLQKVVFQLWTRYLHVDYVAQLAVGVKHRYSLEQFLR